jgi:hypothetical protein
MSNYKSVQDLIVKAAMYDKVSTTIRANELFGGCDVIEIIFSKGDRHSEVYIDMYSGVSNHEEMILYACKSALRKLLWEPYEEIEYAKEK